MTIIERFNCLGLELGGDGEESVCVGVGEGVVDIFLVKFSLRLFLVRVLNFV
jgi:hypothetical protein